MNSHFESQLEGTLDSLKSDYQPTNLQPKEFNDLDDSFDSQGVS